MLALALGLSGCLSGQTGSPDCPGPDNCVCNPFNSWDVLLRVSVTALNEERMEADVVEVLSAGNYGLSPGDHLGGSHWFIGCGVLERRVGDELVVKYSVSWQSQYPNCAAFHACSQQRCQSLTVMSELEACWQGCTDETQLACADERAAALSDGFFAGGAVWRGQEIDFGAGRTLPSADVHVLTENDACVARFPSEPLPPCNDTQSSFSCATTTAPNGALTWLLALGGLGLLARRRPGGRGSAR